MMRRILMVLPLLMVALTFQNCAKIGNADFTASFRDPNAPFFNYPYSEKPEMYSHFQLMRLEKTAGLRKWRFFGAITSADDGVPVSYTLKLYSGDGQLLCPTRTDDFAGGAGSVDFECDSALDPQTTRLEWRITIDGRETELIREQTYSPDDDSN